MLDTGCSILDTGVSPLHTHSNRRHKEHRHHQYRVSSIQHHSLQWPLPTTPFTLQPSSQRTPALPVSSIQHPASVTAKVNIPILHSNRRLKHIGTSSRNLLITHYSF